MDASTQRHLLLVLVRQGLQGEPGFLIERAN